MTKVTVCAAARPAVEGFFDVATNTISYLVVDPATSRCAVIDSLLDYDAASGRTSTESADRIVAAIRERELGLDWIIDTHVHADHLTAAPYIRDRLGGRMGIGAQITEVQKVFSEVFNEDTRFHTDGSQFDHLFEDGEHYQVGSIDAYVIHTPGHTPACATHLIGDAAFVGDTLFMPDFGSARCDFPGGDAHQLYQSVQRIYELPDDTRMFLCHDYQTEERKEFVWETTVGAQKRENIHMSTDTTEEEFVAMRKARDEQLGMPKLILPSVQVNMRAGHFPPPEDDGQRYLKVPLNRL